MTPPMIVCKAFALCTFPDGCIRLYDCNDAANGLIHSYTAAYPALYSMHILFPCSHYCLWIDYQLHSLPRSFPNTFNYAGPYKLL